MAIIPKLTYTPVLLPSTTKFLRDDGVFEAPSGSGTITLTGDVTGSGSGSFVTALAATLGGPHNFTGNITLSGTTISLTGETTTSDHLRIAGPILLDNPGSVTLSAGSTNDSTLGGSAGSKNTTLVTPDAAGSTLTGVQATNNGNLQWVLNVGSGAGSVLTLAHQNAGSSAPNRIVCPGEVDLAIPAGGAALLRYNTGPSRYQVMAVAMPAGSGGGTPGGSNTQVQVNNGGAFGGFATFTYDNASDTLLVAGDTHAPGSTTLGSAHIWNIFPSLGGSNSVVWDDYFYTFTGFALRMVLSLDVDNEDTGFLLYNEFGVMGGGLCGYFVTKDSHTSVAQFPNVPAGPCTILATDAANFSYPLYIGSAGFGCAFGVEPATGFPQLWNPLCDMSTDYQTPATGFTLTISKHTLLLDPAAGLATGTINLPATPLDKQEVRVSTTQTITALTVSGNGNTIKNAPTTLAAGAGFAYIFHSAITTWFRLY